LAFEPGFHDLARIFHNKTRAKTLAAFWKQSKRDWDGRPSLLNKEKTHD
jgi:hypothetical protein